MTRLGVLAVAGVLLVAVPLRAQLPSNGASRADSLAELARLDREVATHRDDAAAWHARGLLAWQLSQGNRAIGTKVTSEQLRLNQIADSSLLRAATLGDTIPRYLADFAIYRSQGSAFVRGGAARYENRAFEQARVRGDSQIVAEMADKLGAVQFKDYQMFFERRQFRDNGPAATIADMMAQQSGGAGGGDFANGSVSINADLVRETIASRSTPVGGNPPPGVEAYDKALAYFETATRAAPSLPLPWRHRFAALADRKRWEELESAAHARLAIAPWDPEAWLALGLAQHRQSRPNAIAAFDSAFAQMTDSTRRRLDRVERIMRPKAARALEAMPEAQQQRTVRFAWNAADPLWSVPGNEVRAEYLARVAFAELRFTDEEKGLHGVDTFPGDLHVRYGFPKYTANYACADGFAENVCWFWWYAPRLQFIVHYVAAFNTGRAGMDDIALNDDIKFQAPASWRDIPGVPVIDSIPMRVAHFRNDGAHPSLFVSGAVPVQRMAVGGVTPRGLTARLWMFADGEETVARDSARTDDAGLVQWRLRAPEGQIYTRAEVVSREASAARGTAFVGGTTPPSNALSMSDVLIASAITDGAAPARRWHELRITPAPDVLPASRSIALAWESYGLASRDGMQHYTIRLLLEKSSKSLAGRIVASIAGMAGLQSGDQRVTLIFNRDGPAREVSLDHIALSLSQAPAGLYTLAVEVTDNVAGTVTRRLTTIQIGK